MALKRKGLAGCLQGATGIDQTDINSWLERSRELQQGGMGVLEADRAVLNEIRDKIDAELNALKEQLGLPTETKEDRQKKVLSGRQSEIERIAKEYDDEIAAVEAEEARIQENLSKLPPPIGRPQFIDASTGKDLGLKAIKNVTFTSSWTGQLLPQRMENGEIKPAQIIVPWKFRDHNGKLFNMGDFIGENGKIDPTLFPPDMMRMIAYRIPTSKQSSMSYVEVVGFFPPEISETVIAPRDLIAQMGLDFDYDKLYLHQFNLALTTDRTVTKYTGEDMIKVHQNDIMQVQHEVLSDPAAQKVITEPIGYGALEDIAKELDEIDMRGGRFNPLSQSYQRHKYLNTKQAKKGVGVFSLLTTFLSSSQTLGKPVYFIEKDGNKRKEVVITFGNETSTRISSTKSKKGTPKSNIASAFQNVALDNESLQIGDRLNINEETFPVINALIASGFDENTIIPFITQPIIRDYVRESMHSKSDLESMSKTPENEAQARVIKKWESEKYDNLEDEEKMVIADSLGAKELMNVLRDKKPDAITQRSLLDKFIRIARLGKDIRRLTSAMTVESTGIPKFFTTAVLREKEIRSLGQINIMNAEKFIGDYQRRSGNILDIVPETIAGYAAIYGLFTNNQLWQNILPYRSVVVNDIYTNLEEVTGMGTADHELRGAWRFNVFKDLVTYIESTNISRDVRAKLFLDTDSNKSLAHTLHNIKESGMLADNPFINMLHAKVDKRDGHVSTISFSNSGADNTIDENIHAGFAELLADDRDIEDGYKVKDFAKDLAIYGSVAGNHLATSFRRYIPIVYQQQLLGPVVDKINFDDPDTIDASSFMTQYVQHNPHTVPAIDPKHFTGEKGKLLQSSPHIKLTDTSIDRYYKSVGRDIQLNDFLSYRHEEGYALYALTDRSRGLYMQIPTLGTFGMDEYQPGVGLAGSIIASRNESTGSISSLIVSKDMIAEEPQRNFINDTQDNVTVTNNDTIQQANKFTNAKTVGDILSRIQKDDTYPYFQFLANVIANKNVRLADRVVTVSELPITWQDKMENRGRQTFGAWNRSSRQLKMSKELGSKHPSLSYKVLLHEVVHALTSDVLIADKTLRQDINNLVNITRGAISESGHPRAHKLFNEGIAPEEFVAEALTDELFQKELAKIKYPVQEEKKYSNILEALIDKLSTAVAKFLGIKQVPENSALKRALADIMNIVDMQQDMNSLFASNEVIGRDDIQFFYEEEQEANRFNVVVEDRQIRIRDLQGTIAKIVNTPGSVKRVEELRARIKEYQSDIEEAQKVDALEDLETFAERDMIILENILSKPDIQIGDYYEARRIINLWKKSIDLLFTDEEKEFITSVNELFQKYKGRAEFYETKLRGVENELMERYLRDEGIEDSVADILAKAKDVGWLHAKTLDIGRYNNAMLDVIAKTLKDSGIANRKDLYDFEDGLTKTVKKVKAELNRLGYSGEKLWDLFRQKRANGQQTGRIVTRYTPEFYDERRKEWLKADGGKDSSYYQWLDKNTEVFDFRKLFRVEDHFEGDDVKFNKTHVTYDKGSPDIQEHQDKLTNLLGKREFDRLMKRLENKLEDYKQRYDYNKKRIWSDFMENEREEQLNLWVQEHSPYWFAENVNAAKRVTTVKNRGGEFTYTIASKPEYYDSNFNTVASNDTLLEFYEMYLDVLSQTKSLLPDHAVEHLGMNAVPYMSKSVGELFGEKGMQAGLTGVWDDVKRKISSPENNPSFLNVDPITEEEIKNIPSKISTDYDRVKQIVDLQKTEYELVHGKPPSTQEELKMRQDAYDLVAREKSFDLEQAIKVIYLVGNNYKHKARVEDQIKLAQSIMENAKEAKRNLDGTVLTDKKGRIQYKEAVDAFKNAKESLDFTIRSFYGLPQQQAGSIGKTLTSEDKAKKKDLEALITKADKSLADGVITPERHGEIVNDLKDKIDNLGRVVKATQVARGFMKYVQLKGMGWNWFSAFNNIGFGVMSNYTTAADGRLYTSEELNEAYTLTLHSILKNNSLNGVVTPTAKKIRALVHKYGLEDIVIDFMKSSRTKGTGFFKRFMPFQLQKHSEYLNYVPVMIAMMKHEGIWDSYNEKGEWIGKGEEVDIKAKVRRVVSKNHGNYDPDSAIQVDKNLFGQMAAQFRRWAFEAFANRFEAEKYDHLLGMSQKGRYRSGILMFTRVKTKEGVEPMNLMEKNLFVLKNLMKKLIGAKTNLDDKFTEVDAANLRANLRETLIFATLLAITATLKHLAGEEEDDKAKFAYYTLMNSFGRIQMDLTFYVNPADFERIMRRPVPIMSVITDTTEWFGAFFKYMTGDDILESGIHAGDSRLLRETAQMLPFGTQIYRTIGAGKVIYK